MYIVQRALIYKVLYTTHETVNYAEMDIIFSIQTVFKETVQQDFLTLFFMFHGIFDTVEANSSVSMTQWSLNVQYIYICTKDFFVWGFTQFSYTYVYCITIGSVVSRTLITGIFNCVIIAPLALVKLNHHY